MSDGEICLAEPRASKPDALLCSLPASTPSEGAELLEWLGGGSTGAGARLWRIGSTLPEIRREYERRIKELVVEVERRRAAGQPAGEIARWAVARRRWIATTMRARSGVGTVALFEVRDLAEYGPGGRTFRNIERRYQARGLKGDALYPHMIKGAGSPNTGISTTAIKGARYLKHGGRAILVISIPLTALHADDRTRGGFRAPPLRSEAGGFAGGGVGAGLGAGACLVFGLATSGWGLLACGVVGGLVGGLGGSWAGEKLYYSSNPRVENVVNASGTLPASTLWSTPPPSMCMP